MENNSRWSIGARGGWLLQFLFTLILGMVWVWSATASSPDEVGEKFCIYSNESFSANEYCNSSNLSWLELSWFNKISSIKVAEGYEVFAFKRLFYWGPHRVYSGDVSSLGNWNNKISSLYVRQKSASQDKPCFYSKKNFRGRRFCTDEDQYLFGFFWDDRISSISVPSGYKVTVYRRPFFRGGNKEFTASAAKLNNFNNAVSSIQIELVENDSDSDGDGIIDTVDTCPDSPLGEMVDEAGCALSQLDSDFDGVNDDKDLCPSTTSGDSVNEDGCAENQLDSDQDGVNNDLDQCPATPSGEVVNEVGCGASQLDEDADGVSDALDQCPATPEGEEVNAQGCALGQLDTDNDSVTDDIDECADTPQGEEVNEEGCAQTQLDDDDDGVNNALDQCENTPEGETPNEEGCAASQLDSDEDGVNNALDQCPSTPSGLSVNTVGCALIQLDTDGDGVNDALDQCALTPANEAPNAAGCSPSQLDTDIDGVNDALDQCPATPANSSVDNNGCALSQLDTDEDGVNDELDQCPATPQDQQANEQGCALSQLDTDNDQVTDDLDQCPSTPEGESVNADGCALSQLDTDDDGINDDIDQCADTPATEAIDSEGCSQSQLDTDNDGINDALDQCPNTPEDQTPNAEGCALTQLDADSDGINDAIDQCPNTPVGDTANAEGCSPDQIDSDNDGTPDYLDAFPNDATETSDLDGDGIGDNADQDRDGDGVANSEDLFPDDPLESADIDGDGIGDNADPDRDGDGVANEDDYFPADPTASSVPTVQITSPATLITVGSSPISIAGTVDDNNAIIIINGIVVDQNNGQFSADVALEEGANNIIVRAVDGQNHEGTATISVSLDKTPPYITLQSPEDGSTVYSPSISVSGLVNDIVRGTISENEATVVVNGQTASVSNRYYLAENIALIEGPNQITINAVDAVGNSASETISVIYQPQTGKVIELVSGQAQSAAIQTAVSQPLVVQLTENGAPVVDKTVIFRVTEGDGLLQPETEAEGNGAVVQTNADGLAQVMLKLGSRAGTGNHKVSARAVGFAGMVEFYHSATFGDGIQMGIIDGNNQRGAVRQPLPKPLTLAVTDAGANLIPNAPIEFEVTKGSGSFNNGETTFNTTTDTDGRASAIFILGSEEGLDVQRITARLLGSQATAGFTASGLMPGDPGQTSISGVVLDNQDQPMPNVTVRVDGSTRQGITDEQGQFTITEAPVGPVHLLVEGSTTTREGEWPSLSYNIVTVPGAENPMASPIYLVEIDTENAVYVGIEDKIVTHPEIPGFELDVKAGSVTFPDGAKEGFLSITRVNANKIPMPPPNGMQPQLIVTIQPHGAVFDPPARLTIPNTDGHAPLSEIEMYSYDHDLEEFVTIGLGQISKDGAQIISKEGVGVIKAGWHCGSAPAASGCCIDCAHCWDKANPGSCGCEKFLPNLALEQQKPDDCRINLCDGSWVESDETSALSPSLNVPLDCSKPRCIGGSRSSINDPTDLEEAKKKCYACENEDDVFKPDRLLPEDEQEPDDCRELLCGGGFLSVDESSNLFDQRHDCMKPICVGGSPDLIDYPMDIDTTQCDNLFESALADLEMTVAMEAARCEELTNGIDAPPKQSTSGAVLLFFTCRKQRRIISDTTLDSIRDDRQKCYENECN